MTLRKHQSDVLNTINSIIAGDNVRKIIVNATPAAGKSMLPILAGQLIPVGLADALAWIVPRKALQSQGERGFVDPGFRSMLNHNLTIRQSTSDINPCRDCQGWVSTYQALSMDRKGRAEYEFSTKRYILILDECHHISASVEADWYRAVLPLVEKAKYLVLMTGTMERSDGKPIAWLPYRKTANGLLESVTESHGDTRYIHYDRTTALREKAILPVQFHLSDGTVEWEKNGSRRKGILSKRIMDSGQALFTALNTEFAETLLDAGLAHWQSYKNTHPRSKMLIVTANFEHAKKATAYVERRGFRCAIATSHDSVKCLQNIYDFKFGSIDCLITIAVAYEGLSVKPITHIVCLTQIRSNAWITQMVGRAVRVDHDAGPYETQSAYVFAPDDFQFQQVVKRIESEQLTAIKDEDDVEEKRSRKGGGRQKSPDVIPIGSTLTGQREISIGGPPGGFAFSSNIYIPTPKEVESELLSKIESHVRIYSYMNRIKPIRINAVLKDIFNKPRREMTRIELEKCLKYVQENYPTNFPVRGSGRRVPTKAERWYG